MAKPLPGEDRDHPLSLDDRHPFAVLRATLRQNDYSVKAIRERLHTSSANLGVLDLPVFRQRLTGDGPLETLIRLFLFDGAPIPLAAARAALSPLSLEAVADIGLIRVEGDQVRSTLTLLVYDGLFFVCDNYRLAVNKDPGADHVTAVNMTSELLSALTIRRPIDSALDLGTGCGVQALQAARHARRVVATDVNRRALNMTAFNAKLNGLANVDCRFGSFFEPVKGEQFDLIVTNPPFVISPESRFQYRDGGKPGDTLTEQVARELPAYLKEGGYGHILGNWAVKPDGEWDEPPRHWLKGAGVDVLPLFHGRDEAVTYAARWLMGDHLGKPDAFAEALKQWLDAYRRLGIEEITSGALVVRKRTPSADFPNWFEPVRNNAYEMVAAGEQLARLFQVGDYCRQLPERDAILERRLVLADDLVLEQVFTVAKGRFKLSGSRLRPTEGLTLESRLDGLSVELISKFDGTRPVGECIDELGKKYAMPETEYKPTCIELVFRLLRLGFLVPADVKATALPQ